MELNELRMNNFVSFQQEAVFETLPTGKEIMVRAKIENKILKIDAKLMYAIFSGNLDYDISKFEPIPLNEERLLNMGFEKLLGEFTMSGFPFVIYLNQIWTDTESDDDAICRVDFVHELQNFFFIFKRRELEIDVDALQ